MDTPSTPELSNFDPTDWNYHGYWKANIFTQYFWFSAFDPQKAEELGLPLSESGFLVFANGFYLTKRAVTKKVEVFMRNQLTSGDLSPTRRLRAEMLQTAQAAVTFVEHLTLPFTAETWEEFINQGNKATFFWSLAAGYFALLSDVLLNEAIQKEGLDASLIPQIISQQDTLHTEMYRSLFALKQQFEALNLPITSESLLQNPDLASKVEEHRKNYAWIQVVSWIGPPLTTLEVFGMIQKSHPLDAPQLDRSHYSVYLQNALEMMETSWFMRQASVEYFGKFTFIVMPYLEKLATDMGITYRELLHLTPPEIGQYLQKELKNNEVRELVEQRKEGDWLAWMHDGKEKVVENAHDVALLKKLMVPTADSLQKELKGQIGNRGKAKGIVKIVLSSDDFKKMEPGNILVSTMTTPDFVVVMQQAAGFVTDNGGMLCHAAILARELNKPCIIGTKIGTHLLKDGDLVEVDADNGVVRKLEV